MATKHKDWNINEYVTGRFKDGKPIIGATFQNGLNDKEPNGSFVSCDMTIEAVNIGVTTHKIKRGRYGQLRLGDTTSNKPLIKIKDKNMKGISLQYINGVSGSVVVGDKKASFPESNGVGIDITPTYKGVKVELVISDPQTAPIEYPFSLKDYGQKYSYGIVEGAIIGTGEDGEKITLHAPYAIDAEGDRGQVDYVMTGIVSNLQTFKKVVNETWLRSRVGEVRIDPVITIDDDTGTLSDMFMSSYSANLDYNFGIFNINAAHRNAANNQAVGWSKVGLSSYSNITVTDAYWGFDVYGATGVPNVYGYQCLRDIIAGTKNGAIAGTGEPSWNSYSHPSGQWASGGGRGVGDRVATADNNQVFSINSNYHFAVSNALTQFWIDNPSSNFGEFFDVPSVPQSALWRSSEKASGNKPYFHMEWIEAALYLPSRGRMINMGGNLGGLTKSTLNNLGGN